MPKCFAAAFVLTDEEGRHERPHILLNDTEIGSFQAP